MNISNFLQTAQRLYQEPTIPEIVKAFGASGFNGTGMTRGDRFLNRVADSLDYDVIYVPGKGIDDYGNPGTNFGVTRFGDNVIYVARDLPRPLRGYVAIHEAFEASEKARNPAYTARGAEHSRMELDCLDFMKRNGYVEEYEAALNMHMERYGGSNREVFADIEQQVYNRFIELHAEKSGKKGIYKTMPVDDGMKIGYDSPEIADMVKRVGGNEFGKYFQEGKELATNPRNYIAGKLDDFSKRFSAGEVN